jgi:serine/threonine protein kinase
MSTDEKQTEGQSEAEGPQDFNVEASLAEFTMDTDGNIIDSPSEPSTVIVVSEEDEPESDTSDPTPSASRPVTAEFDRTMAGDVLTSEDLDFALSGIQGDSVTFEEDEDSKPITRRSVSGETRVESPFNEGDPTAGSLDERIRQKLDEADSRPDEDPMIGMVLGNSFEVLQKIGEGGMGAVYRARQRGIEREVAIKVLLGDVARDKTLVRRFHLEALAISKLKHPNTIQIFDFGEEDGLLYIAMEFLEGTTLHSLLEFEEVLSVQRACRITRQMSQSLREAHSKGIIHRDLKPDNVFLTTVGEERDFVKVLDFGVAKLRESDKKGATVTKTGTIFGTPRYMSPEQAKGKPVDERADLYAIGIMLYEMVMGAVPFESDNHLGVLILHVQKAPPTFLEMRPDLVIPTAFEAVVFKLLAKSPEARYQTSEALIRDLERVDKGLEEIFRNVVRREEVLSHGYNVIESESTHHDTRLHSGAEIALPTVGPFSDSTLTVEQQSATAKGGSWFGYVLKFSVALAAGIAVFVSLLEPLPATFHGIPTLTTLDVGIQPEAQIPWSQVTIASDPAEAEVHQILADGTQAKVGKTPLSLRRHRGAPAETYVFTKVGYQRYQRSFDFTEDQAETVQLAAEKKPASPARRPAKRSSGKKSAKKPAAKAFTYEPGKVGNTKSSPY